MCKGVYYNFSIENESYKKKTMNETVDIINDILQNNFRGLLSVNPTKIYNMLKRPKLVSKNLKNLITISYFDNSL
tara:strand:- start:13 stop:237 length:225 start_codon:yes stop_codon:yes gene_type:complete